MISEVAVEMRGMRNKYNQTPPATTTPDFTTFLFDHDNNDNNDYNAFDDDDDDAMSTTY